MKKRLAFAASAALLITATSASAVSLNPRGVGQVLLYPYYTVNAGQDTLLTVINASGVGKVIKVRFLEGYNGRPVLEVPVFLSATDVWTAVVSQTAADAGAKITTSDTSCTFPIQLPAAGQPFSNASYAGLSTPPFFVADSGPQTLARTREGHIEIVADADIVPGSPTDLRIRHPDNFSGGTAPPTGCAQLTGNFQADLTPPTSGLVGSASIVNVGNGTFFAYDAEALNGFTDAVMGWGSSTVPNDTLADGHSTASAFPGGGFAEIDFDSGESVSLDYPHAIDAVSAVLMKAALYNEYLSSEAIGAATDWVITFPTKRFYVDRQVYAGNDQPLFDNPFADGRSYVSVDYDIHDHEAAGSAFRCVSPSQPGCPQVPLYEVNVLGVLATALPGTVSSVLGSALGKGFDTGRDGGWMKMDLAASTLIHHLTGGQTATGVGITLDGLPATGFMVYNIVNANAAPGRLANYGGAFPHRSSVLCTSVPPTISPACFGASVS